MRRVDIDSNFGQVARTIENHFSGPHSLPPEGHPNSRVCPQCHQATWRMTQHCACCGLDLFALDNRERRRRIAWRRMRVAGFFALVSALAFWGQSHVPTGMRLWVMGAGVISIIFAAAVMHD
ncbi:MAG: hypothetical protein HYU74_12600 [Dechloromonas sp.]|nr:hypothetical protein [Dechloromonas sp.]